MVALGLEFLAEQLAVPRRVLPVDEAGIHAGRVLAQRVELGALAALALHLDPEERFLGVELQRRALHAADIGQDGDRALDRDAARQLDERQRPVPPDPQPVDRDLAAALRHHRQGDALRRAGLELGRDDDRGIELAALLEEQLEPRLAAVARRRDRRRDRAALADIELVRRRHLDGEQPPREGQQRVARHRHQHQRAIIEAERPERRVVDDQDQRQRYAAEEDEDGAPGRPDHRIYPVTGARASDRGSRRRCGRS